MNNVFVSVIIPHYNQKEFLPEAVDSVLKSTFPYYEIVIVDDCSNQDGAREVVKRLSRNNSKVRYFFNKKNMGLSYTRNRGIREARGEYILPLDSDDMISPDCIMKMYKALQFLKVDIVSSYTERFGEIGELQKRYQLPNYSLKQLLGNNTLNYCSMYRKTHWREVGGYDEKMKDGYEDWEFWINMGLNGHKAFIIPEYLFCYRIRKNSMLSQSKLKHTEIFDYIQHKHSAIYGEGLSEPVGKGKKLALLNRNPKLWLGGDVIQIEEMGKELSKYYECTYIHNSSVDLSAYEYAILFHCNTDFALAHARNLKKQGKKYIVNAIFYSKTNTQATVNYICKNAEAIVFFSEKEKEEFNKEIFIDKPQFVIPNGTSSRFHNKNSLEGNVGVISASPRNDKGENVIEEICKELKVPYIATNGIAHKDMPEHLQQAKVFINGSKSERMSLSTGEALCSNLRVIDTKYNRGNEWYKGIVEVDTFNKEEMKEAIKNAYFTKEWDYTPNECARKLTWEMVALEYKKILEKL